MDSWTSYRNGANPMVAYGPGDPRLHDEQTNFSHYMLAHSPLSSVAGNIVLELGLGLGIRVGSGLGLGLGEG